MEKGSISAFIFTRGCQGLTRRSCSVSASQMVKTAAAALRCTTSAALTGRGPRLVSPPHTHGEDGCFDCLGFHLGEAPGTALAVLPFWWTFPTMTYPHCCFWNSSLQRAIILRSDPLLACSRGSTGPSCSKGLSSRNSLGAVLPTKELGEEVQCPHWELSLKLRLIKYFLNTLIN